MKYGSIHECDEMSKRKGLMSSVPVVRRRERRDGGACLLELRVREGDYKCMDINIVYCPWCGARLRDEPAGEDVL